MSSQNETLNDHDYSLERPDFFWINESTRTFLERGYLTGDQTPEERIREIADNAARILDKPEFSDKFYHYMARGYISLSSPVWSNFGKTRGLPISCFGSYVADDMGSILATQAEVGMMTKYGGGTSGYFGALRGRGTEIKDNGQSSGSVHFMQLFEKIIDVISQGAVRRGSFSPYLPISHPDIHEFLDIGTEGNPIQMLNHAVTVPEGWLQEMIDGDADKRATWAKLIQRRGEMGYPYVLFEDNANNNTVDVYKDKNLKIVASNLCSEIMLPSTEEYSFVCCLSSLNALFFDEWKDTDLVETMTYFLDAVMTEFCTRLEELRDSDDRHKQLAFRQLERSYNFARDHRAIGIGVLGWHSLLQSKMLAFDSQEANQLNVQLFKTMKEQAYAASERAAQEYGEAPLLEGYGRRNTTLMAVAPTTSSAFILGQVSQSIEPIWSNCYVKDLAKLKVTIKNPFLKKLLAEKGYDDKVTWASIRDNDGSVQHLDWMSDEEKEVFRTFAEIDQVSIIEQAAVRQRYIDQGQSLNIAISPEATPKEINALYLQAHRQGIKALYYQHSINAAQALSRKKICESCEA